MKLTEWFWRRAHPDIFAELNILRKIAHSNHMAPHFNEMGGCLCYCPECLGSIKLYQLSDGSWHAARSCTCVNCSQHCTSLDGRFYLTVTQEDKDIIITPGFSISLDDTISLNDTIEELGFTRKEIDDA